MGSRCRAGSPGARPLCSGRQACRRACATLEESGVPEPDALQHEEVLYVLEQARAPLTAEQIHEQLRLSDPELELRSVRLTLRALEGEGRVREHAGAGWALRVVAPAPVGPRLPSTSTRPPGRRVQEEVRRSVSPAPSTERDSAQASRAGATTQDEIWESFARPSSRSALQTSLTARPRSRERGGCAFRRRQRSRGGIEKDYSM